VLLGLPQLRGLYNAKNIAAALATVIQEYQFDYKLGCLITDNAGNNNDLYDHLLQSLSVPKKERLRCVGHVINLIVKARDAHNQCNRNRPIDFDSYKIGLCDYN